MAEATDSTETDDVNLDGSEADTTQDLNQASGSTRYSTR
jgi:hypothetical protein